MKRRPPAAFFGLCLVGAALAGGEREPALKGLVPPGMFIGAALSRSQSDEEDTLAVALVVRHFNSISPENVLKWSRSTPSRTATPSSRRIVTSLSAGGTPWR